jgi:hypothetical protein
MVTIENRLKKLEQRVIDSENPSAVIVQIVDGKRTQHQQMIFDQAIIDEVEVITVMVRDCSLESGYREY